MVSPESLHGLLGMQGIALPTEGGLCMQMTLRRVKGMQHKMAVHHGDD